MDITCTGWRADCYQRPAQAAMETRVLLARIDGAAQADARCLIPRQGRRRAGVSFDRAKWPHGESGRAIPHGAVFSIKIIKGAYVRFPPIPATRESRFSTQGCHSMT